jgi:hypothetical protein
MDEEYRKAHRGLQIWLTTEEAAEYLRLAGPSSIRAAVQRGLLRPDGKNGSRGSYLFRVETLDRYAMSFVPPPKVPRAQIVPPSRQKPTVQTKPTTPIPAKPAQDYRKAMREVVDKALAERAAAERRERRP